MGKRVGMICAAWLFSLASFVQSGANPRNATKSDRWPCAVAETPEAAGFKAAPALAAPNIAFFGDAAVILEYQSVDDVHTPRDSVNYPNIRTQPGHFDWDRILQDLAQVIDPANYSFVALYTLHEVPGWLWNGSTTGIAARNLGSLNSLYNGLPPWNIIGVRAQWKVLREIPHMNSVEFLESTDPALPNANSTLSLFHEIDHYWGVKITAQSAVGPREWDPQTDPVAWLASCCGHWTWVWEGAGMPGIMYSGPTSSKFNAFDLYFMGVMGYNEAKQYSYQVYEEPRSEPPVLHQVTLDSLIYALSLAGGDLYEGDGQRVPDTDPTVQNLRTLIVIVKGEEETFAPADRDRVQKLVADIPGDWQIATWGRSAMSAGIDENSNSGLPYQVILARPADGLVPPAGAVTLEWDRSPFADSYRVQLATTPDFASPVLDLGSLTATTLEVASLQEDIDIYWRVRANNTSGNAAWSRTGTFRLGQAQTAAGIVVDNTADSGPNSLRDAIEQANANAGPDTIRFAIPRSDPGYFAPRGTWGIRPQSPLPAISGDSLFIDGHSQADFIGEDTNPAGPEIVLDGSQSGQNSVGLSLMSAGNLVSHLVICGFSSYGIQIVGLSGHSNTIADCYIGTDPRGTVAVPNLEGVFVYISSGNLIGGTRSAGGNLISGNSNNGIECFGLEAATNRISGNLIGTDAAGTTALGNGAMGIAIYSFSHDNLIGGSQPGEGNLLSGNGNDGARVGGDNNRFEGNFVGTDISGTAALGNSWDGIGIWAGEGNLIGGSDAGAGNLVSANGKLGIYVRSAHNTVQGNRVGTDVSGAHGLNPQASGIGVGSGAQDNTVGPDNVVAFNSWGVQVWADSSYHNRITRNSIFSNQSVGILIRDGGNFDMPAPVLLNYANSELRGTAAARATIEVFSDDADQGRVYEGKVMADGSGNFVWNGVPTASYLTATATDSAGNTSGFSAALNVTGVEAPRPQQPLSFSLQQNYPNPFNPTTKILFSLPRAMKVRLEVFDLLGNEVANIFSGSMPAGEHSVTFEAGNLPSGIYFYRLQAGVLSETRKFMLLR